MLFVFAYPQYIQWRTMFFKIGGWETLLTHYPLLSLYSLVLRMPPKFDTLFRLFSFFNYDYFIHFYLLKEIHKKGSSFKSITPPAGGPVEYFISAFEHRWIHLTDIRYYHNSKKFCTQIYNNQFYLYKELILDNVSIF